MRQARVMVLTDVLKPQSTELETNDGTHTTP